MGIGGMAWTHWKMSIWELVDGIDYWEDGNTRIVGRHRQMGNGRMPSTTWMMDIWQLVESITNGNIGMHELMGWHRLMGRLVYGN